MQKYPADSGILSFSKRYVMQNILHRWLVTCNNPNLYYSSCHFYTDEQNSYTL